MPYPEEALVPWAAIKLNRPIKWIEDRHENFVAMTQERPITRADIETKLRQIRGEVEDVGSSARSIGVIVGAVAVVAVVGAVYLFGRRKGRKEKTVVEIRRI